MMALSFLLDKQASFGANIQHFNRASQQFTIDVNTTSSIDRILDNQSDVTSQPNLFLINCSLNCIKEILKRVTIIEIPVRGNRK